MSVNKIQTRDRARVHEDLSEDRRQGAKHHKQTLLFRQPKLRNYCSKVQWQHIAVP